MPKITHIVMRRASNLKDVRIKFCILTCIFNLLSCIFYFSSYVHAVDIAEAKQFHVLKTIIIDPGHGGEDTGAVGPTGIKEKDLTLAVAKKLKDVSQGRTIHIYRLKTAP